MATPITVGAYDVTFNGGPTIVVDGLTFTFGSDAIVTKFAEDGASLIGSTFIQNLSKRCYFNRCY